MIIFTTENYTMKIQIKERTTNQNIEGKIAPPSKQDIPLKKNGWQFNWKTLYKTEGATFFKLTLTISPNNVEGMLMLTLMNEEMLYMNNIEVAPHNLGSSGKYDNIAGSLIAYACYKSFELGKEHYRGYLTFDSKTKLIPLYQKKYGATLAMGQKMFIEPKIGKHLIEKYLNK